MPRSASGPAGLEQRHFGAHRTDDEDGTRQVLDEVGDEADRIFAGSVDVVENEADRPARGVALEEILDDGAPEKERLGRIVAKSLREGAVCERDVEDLPEEEANVSHLAVFEHARNLAGIADASHAEYGPGGTPVISLLSCSLMDQTITIFGTLHVSEYKENSQMLGLYRLDGEKGETSPGS